jgi:hypothetical protein
MRKLFVLVLGLVTLLSGNAWALIGTPCDPETDFIETFLVKDWDKLPHKNQEESESRVAAVNARNCGITWTYRPEPNTPLYICLSYGAATMADWWALQYGVKLPTYRSYAHGGIEHGYNPRKLELRYRKRGKLNLITYAMTRLSDRDPITKEPVPIRPKGFARLLVDKGEETLLDPVDRVNFSYKATDYPMENEWFCVVTKNWNRDAAEENLMKALKDFGPLYVQFEMPGKHFLFGTHAPVVVGWGRLPGGKVVFICHDSFGNFPKEHVQDARGAAAYRYVSADEIDEAIVFPHTPKVRVLKGSKGTYLWFHNRTGRSLAVRKVYLKTGLWQGKWLPLARTDIAFIPLSQKLDDEIQVYVEADYYMAKDNKGHWLKVKTSQK